MLPFIFAFHFLSLPHFSPVLFQWRTRVQNIKKYISIFSYPSLKEITTAFIMAFLSFVFVISILALHTHIHYFMQTCFPMFICIRLVRSIVYQHTLWFNNNILKSNLTTSRQFTLDFLFQPMSSTVRTWSLFSQECDLFISHVHVSRAIPLVCFS